jgi:NAD+ synthase (glutamine-hydrolysing)
VVDVDLDRIRQERLRQGTFDDNRRTLGIGFETVAERPPQPAGYGAERPPQPAGSAPGRGFREVGFALTPPTGDIGLRRKLDRFPFVPDDADRLALDCYEAYHIQVAGLMQRLEAIGQPKAVIGISGGLDSTHALIVAARAMDALGRPRSDVLAFTMPGFATGEATKSLATRLAGSLGVTFQEIDIKPAAEQLLKDLDHPAADGDAAYDVTYENVQAGLRTDYLFRLANQRGGIVIGTGDLSELALGWCTYGVGDQMSHYGVNAGVPKTLIQHLIRWVIDSEQLDAAANEVLTAILGQEITPELIPTVDGQKAQATEDTVGPYALQDFTLYHVIRRGYRPTKIAFLAWHAWHDAEAGEWPSGFRDDRRTAYDLATIRSWLEVFCRRFFGSQFKRSALPNGPKVSAGGTMSPRGDWRMPSDAAPTAWLADLENVPLA